MVGAFIYEFSNEESGATLQAPAHSFTSLNEIENEAFFAMLEYDVSDNLSLSAEGRFYDEEKSFADNNLTNQCLLMGLPLVLLLITKSQMILYFTRVILKVTNQVV